MIQITNVFRSAWVVEWLKCVPHNRSVPGLNPVRDLCCRSFPSLSTCFLSAPMPLMCLQTKAKNTKKVFLSCKADFLYSALVCAAVQLYKPGESCKMITGEGLLTSLLPDRMLGLGSTDLTHKVNRPIIVWRPF